MPGDEKKRFCDTCGKHVYNLSEHTEVEARAIFREARGAKVCARFSRDPRDGSVRFRVAALAAAVVVGASACSSTPQPVAPATEVDHDMGDAIPDAVDRCPEPTTGTTPGEDGCP